MIRLATMLFAIVGTSLAGIAIVFVLVIGQTTLIPIVAAAAVGFLVSIPVSVLIARAIRAAG
jgi:putative flippase GtrA